VSISKGILVKLCKWNIWSFLLIQNYVYILEKF
jgi:hypothetical protein